MYFLVCILLEKSKWNRSNEWLSIYVDYSITFAITNAVSSKNSITATATTTTSIRTMLHCTLRFWSGKSRWIGIQSKYHQLHMCIPKFYVPHWLCLCFSFVTGKWYNSIAESCRWELVWGQRKRSNWILPSDICSSHYPVAINNLTSLFV